VKRSLRAAEIRRRGADSWTPVFADLAERQWDDAERRARARHPVSACQVGNLPLSVAVLFDWLDETLAA
jgi:hypothetical protein